jgi:hypothetical protein
LIGVCQVRLADRDETLVRVLPEAFELTLDTWLAMHEACARAVVAASCSTHLPPA